MSEAQSGYIAFRPRARLLKLIGEELISDEVVALTELVKNAHDADASRVAITFRNVLSPDGEIEIVDDGYGMDLDTLLGGWMEPAGSTKADTNARLTGRGRRVLGEKGVGRFAADKLGRALELISLRAGTNGEVRAVFDWDRFDTDGQMLSEVKNRWEIRPACEVKGQGTILRIRGLRQAWNERMFRRLSTRLSRLRPPFKNARGFSICIESDEFPDYSGEQTNSFLGKAPYAIDADFDGRETLRIELRGKKTTIPVGTSLGELTCGPVSVKVHAFDLETDAIAKIGPRHEVRAWLREWSGVSVYRDGFRVWPYGEPHDDWLRLDQRRVNNPVVRLSNNQVVGFVEISRDRNPELFDQTNREGLMNNRAFADLRRLIEYTFQLLEAERQRVRHPVTTVRSEKRKKKRVELPVADAIESLAKLANRSTAAHMRRLAEDARDTIARQETEKSRLIDGYNDLAAAGQVATGIGQVAARRLEEVAKDFAALRSKIRHPGMASIAGKLEVGLAGVAAQLAMLAAVSSGGSHRRRTMDVAAEVREFAALFQPMLDDRGVRMEIVPGADLVRVDMNPQSFQRVLYVLMSNSLDWLGRTEDPRISVEIRDAGHHAEVGFSDNGPGIGRELASRVFDPMFSLKEAGRGMGLTIAKGLVEQNGGSIEVILDGRRRGAHFRMRLPRKRSRATVDGG
jgi:signal transduction histidine kinase